MKGEQCPKGTVAEISSSGAKLCKITKQNDLTVHHGKNNKCLTSEFQTSEIANLSEAQRISGSSTSFARSSQKDSSPKKSTYSRGFSMSSNIENDHQDEISISVDLNNIDNPISIGLQMLDKKIDQEATELKVSYSNLLS